MKCPAPRLFQRSPTHEIAAWDAYAEVVAGDAAKLEGARS